MSLNDVKLNASCVVKSVDVVDEKTKAAIIAAIYMYYLQEENNCEFIVRNIKRVQEKIYA